MTWDGAVMAKRETPARKYKCANCVEITAHVEKGDTGKCLICGDISMDHNESGISLIYGPRLLRESRLYLDEHFILTPAPGTLVPG